VEISGPMKKDRYDVHDLLRLHKIVKDLVNVFEFVKHDRLQALQSKVESLDTTTQGEAKTKTTIYSDSRG
jgi:hypothetical protein